MILSTRKQKRNYSKTIRAHVGLPGSSCPIVEVDGFSPPEEKGDGFYWTWTPNPDGTRVWSNTGRSMYRTYYHASTHRIEVGKGWLIEQGLI